MLRLPGAVVCYLEARKHRSTTDTLKNSRHASVVEFCRGLAYLLGEIPSAIQEIREKSANVLDDYPPLPRSTWRLMKSSFCEGDLRHCISDLIGEERKDDIDLGGDCVEWTLDAADVQDLRLLTGVFAVDAGTVSLISYTAPVVLQETCSILILQLTPPVMATGPA